MSIYHFHQLPVYFLLSNVVAVPLSTVILLAEILLCIFSFLPTAAHAVGLVVQWLIHLLNNYINSINLLPFATWDHLQISYLQLLFILIMIAGFAAWFINRKNNGMWVGLTCLLFTLGLRAHSFYLARHQTKVVVYNIPHSYAIDFINGRNLICKADPSVLQNSIVQNLTLKPSRTLNRTSEVNQMNGLLKSNEVYKLGGTAIYVMDKPMHFKSQVAVDILILSNNQKIELSSLTTKVRPKLIIADASNKTYRLDAWKKQADSLGIPFYDVTREGAFVGDLR
jgi:competence protein ComEC